MGTEGGDKITQEFFEDFAERWLDAWNATSSDRVLDLVADEFTWDDRVFWPHVIHDREELRTYLERLWAALPDVEWTEVDRFFSTRETGGIVLFSQTGSAPGSLKSERRYQTHGSDVLLGFRGGKLSRYVGTYDIVGMLEQMGALPPRDGRPGGAYIMSLTRRGV